MKLLIASDIHGAAGYCRDLLAAWDREGADRLLLLGDLLYHGPRNDLPPDYAPKEVIALLNARKNQIFCVRGNCDGEVDQMVLEFPIMADYALISLENADVYATHGHHYNEKTPPPFPKGSILLYGHTHVPVCNRHDGFVAMNPGSVSIPKEGSAHGFMVWENGAFSWKNLEDGSTYRQETIRNVRNLPARACTCGRSEVCLPLGGLAPACDARRAWRSLRSGNVAALMGPVQESASCFLWECGALSCVHVAGP